jgi:hypothetical protein
VTLIVPMTLLVAWATQHRVARGPLVLVAGLMLTPSMLPEAAQDLALVYGSYTLAYAIVFAMLLAGPGPVVAPRPASIIVEVSRRLSSAVEHRFRKAGV